jgi:ferredoxin
MRMRLRVDWLRCDGQGLCAGILPERIELDDWQFPILRPDLIDGALVHEAQRAVDCCPRKALTLEADRPDRRAR